MARRQTRDNRRSFGMFCTSGLRVAELCLRVLKHKMRFGDPRVRMAGHRLDLPDCIVGAFNSLLRTILRQIDSSERDLRGKP